MRAVMRAVMGAVMGRAKAVVALVVLSVALFGVSADGATGYQPSAVFCADPGIKTLCPVIPSNIGDDPPLHFGDYSGVFPKDPTAKTDLQSPFDNYSWQLFVALNWPAGTPPKSVRAALTGDLGPRVWETWNRVSQVFGPSPGLAHCGPTPAGLERFDIGSDTYGRPVGENEEYIQAATGDPVIDVSGNWTIYERRVGNVEVAFLKAPYGHKEWTLTTRPGARRIWSKITTRNPRFSFRSPATRPMAPMGRWRSRRRGGFSIPPSTPKMSNAITSGGPS
ncbi:MAG TPA: hypothetical protein VL048_02640 [Xanthobacteraceae bacterium]|nr:hypothetical protein [Xanthobacteraceae bacterium]